jgi:hypothetical protein
VFELDTKELSEELMEPIPLAAVVERHQEEIGASRVRESRPALPSCSSIGIAERAAHTGPGSKNGA